MAAITRQGPGTPQGGEFAKKANPKPSDALHGTRPLVRATAGPVQVSYEDAGDSIRISVLLRDEGQSTADRAEAWVEEGAVLTATPSTADRERMSSVASSQAGRLAAALERGDDEHETIDAFLADVADRRDPFITRGLRRRHGEELEAAPWPDLDR